MLIQFYVEWSEGYRQGTLTGIIYEGIKLLGRLKGSTHPVAIMEMKNI